MAKVQKSKETKPVINDLIFKELIKRGYSLEGNTRVWNIADSKLWYLTPEQAQGYLDLEKDEKYQKSVIQTEMDLINNNMETITKLIGSNSINVIDLGCGDGKKAVIFLSKLKERLKQSKNQNMRIRYCPVDISSYMVEKALKKIKEVDVEEVIKFQWNISDFENIENIASILRYADYKKNLFLLLGNTLGNFEINELLYEVRSAMAEGDILIIGNGLDSQNEAELVKSYQNKEIDSWLSKILVQLGLRREDLEYGARFKNSRIEEYFIVNKDIEISFLGKKVSFHRGDQIIAAVSYKYTSDDFKAFLKMYFSESEIFTSKGKTYALAICKK